MSTNSDPTKSRLWLDGDGFRAATGTAMPADGTIFSGAVAGFDAFGGIQAGFTVNKEQASTDFTIWNADGPYRTKKDPVITTIAIRCVDLSKATVLTVLQGGQIVTTAGTAYPAHDVSTAYTVGDKVTLGAGSLEATEAGTSGATPPALPSSVGSTVVDGTVTWVRIESPTDIHEWETGEDEEFSLLLNAVDPSYGKVAYYAQRCTLNTTPSEVINDEALYGWDFEIKILAPTGGGKALRKFTDVNPLGV